MSWPYSNLEENKAVWKFETFTEEKRLSNVNVLVKATFKVVNGFTYTTAFVVYQIAFNLGALVQLQTQKISL